MTRTTLFGVLGPDNRRPDVPQATDLYALDLGLSGNFHRRARWRYRFLQFVPVTTREAPPPAGTTAGGTTGPAAGPSVDRGTTRGGSFHQLVIDVRF